MTFWESHLVSVGKRVKAQEDDFTDLYFRYLAARRDYPYAQHSPPVSSRPYAERLIKAIEQEFKRSNP